MTIEEQLASLAGQIVHVTYYHSVNIEIIGVLRSGINELGKYRVVFGNGCTSFGYAAFHPKDVNQVRSYDSAAYPKHFIELVRKDNGQC